MNNATPILPHFNPALWVEQATRRIDLAEGSQILFAALTERAIWEFGVDRDARHREVLRGLADTLRSETPLFALTAALVAPWLLVALGHEDGDGNEEGREIEIEERLVALLHHRYGAASQQDYDPWMGLAEWLWSHQNAWAVAAMQRELGRDTVRALPDRDYRQLITDYVSRSDATELRDRASQLLITYAQELAKVVVDALDLATLTPARRRLLLGRTQLRDPAALLPPVASPPPAVRGIVAPFPQDNHLMVVGADHYHALREAIYKNTFRRVDGQPWPTAPLETSDGLGEAQLRPPAADGRASLPQEQLDLWAEAMWRQREELSDLDADVLDELCALFLYQARTINDRAVADIDGLLAMRGIRARHRGNGKRGGYEPEQRAEMQRAVNRIQNIWINIATERDPSTPETVRVFQSRLFTMTERVGQLNLGGDLDIDRFVYRPGDLFATYLLGPGAKTTLLSARALKYDPYRQQLEKRLARFLSWQWTAQGEGTGLRRDRRTDRWRAFQVGTLLDAAAKRIDRSRPAVTRERLEHCLDTLLADDVIAAWQYEDWDEELSRRHGWADTWRASIVLIAPPAAVIAQVAQRAARAALPGDSLAPIDDDLATTLKTQRLALGLNQREAAAALGISQGHYSKMERGALADHTPTPAFRERLATWLAERTA